MNLYDEMIVKCQEMTNRCANAKTHCKSDITSWPCENEQEIILKKDMAYELGGTMQPAVSMLAFTSDLEIKDEVAVIGRDLSEIKEDVPYARITLLKIDDSKWSDNQKAYRAMQRIDYTRYHVYPEGFMMRISTSASREPVRISRKSVENGMDFKSIGGTFIDAYHKHKDVVAVKVIFVTDSEFPYQKLSAYADMTNKITMSLDSIYHNLVMDCRSCGLKPVCDEVEGMRELHKTYAEKM